MSERSQMDRAASQAELQQLRDRYQALQQELGRLGWFRRGTLLKRYTHCGKPGCRCQADPPRPHGPYWQWTRKVAGKTQTTRLREEEVPLYQEWEANARKLDGIVQEMQDLAFAAIELVLDDHRPR